MGGILPSILRYRCIPCLFFCAFFSFSGLAAADDKDIGPPAPALYLDAFDKAVRAVARDPKMVGLAVAIIDDGKQIYQQTMGETAYGSGDAVTADTVFRAGSVSKTFTGGLLALLASEGKIDLSVKIPSDLFVLKGGQRPTLAQVASHQTGLPPYAFDLDLEAGVPPQKTLPRLKKVALVCRPGECHTYQNLTFATLGNVIEQAAGSTFENSLAARIFEPYGMATASVGVDQLIEAASWARPHRALERRNRQYRPGNPESPYDNVAPAAAINLSINDLAAWALANLKDSASENGGLALAHQWQTATPSQDRRVRRYRTRMGKTGYGLGWRIYPWDGRELIMHSGRVAGYGAQIILDPERDFAFVALWNADADSVWSLWPTLLDLKDRNEPGPWLRRYNLQISGE